MHSAAGAISRAPAGKGGRACTLSLPVMVVSARRSKVVSSAFRST